MTKLWRGAVSHLLAFLAGSALVVAISTPGARSADDSEFHHALVEIVARMSSGMCTVQEQDADREFARAMIPHHEGAIEMARLELLHGRDARLQRLAQGIMVEQLQEIALMRSILNP